MVVDSVKESLNVLVTGGAGFVGSHLVDRLLEEGHRITVLDNLSTGSAKNLQHLNENTNLTFIRHDVRIPFTRSLSNEEKYDRIYHLACPASPKHYQADPKGTLKTCFFGTLNCLTFASQRGARVLFASTSEVYGDPLEHPQSEYYNGNVPTIGPRACYDEGKRVAETLCSTYSDQLDIRIARIFNTYGPRMSKDDGRVVTEFIGAALEGKPLNIFGNGEQTRSFQYIDDLINGLTSLMELSHNEKNPQVVNLGNPEEYTVKQVAGLILSLTSSKSEIEHVASAQHDPQRRRPDISLAKKLFGWHPKINFTEGLKRTIESFH